MMFDGFSHKIYPCGFYFHLIDSRSHIKLSLNPYIFNRSTFNPFKIKI